MHGLPKGKRKVFRRDNLIQQFILGVIIIGCVVYTFVAPDVSPWLKIASIVAIAIVGTMLVTYYTIELMTGAGYGFAAAFNEFIYLVIGLPVILIAAGFLPASIFISFFSPSQQLVKIIIYAVLGVVELAAIIFLITRFLREKKMNLFQYIRYVFDFERRAKESQKLRERNEQIDNFYSDFQKVEEKIAKRMEEKSAGFEEYNWREKVGALSGKKTQEIKCWNCSRMNDEDALFCSNCSAPLKKK